MVCQEAVKNVIDTNIRSLVGEVLTLIDGVVREDVARKASKDMARKLIYGFGQRVKLEVDCLERDASFVK